MNRSRIWFVLLALCSISLVVSNAWGQRGSYGGGDRGSSDRGGSDRGSSDRGSSDRGSSDRGGSDRGSSDRGGSDRGRGGFDPSEMLKRMDQNGNGSIEPSELSDRSRGFVGDLAKRANLDPTQPIPVEKLVSAAQQARSERESGGSSSSSGSSGSDSGRDSGRDRERSSSTPSKPATPAVPGFGAVSTTPPKAAGFDVPLSVDTTVPLEKRYDARVIEYVDNMLKDQDKNKDGFIDNIEWKEGRWSTPPEESDTNKDNRLSRAELCERIARRFGLTAPPGSTTSSSGGGSGDRSRGGSDNKSGSSDGSNAGEAAKFKQYAESLIRQFDKNKNGMLEKDEWSDMKSEHRAADMNGDGVITVDELTAKLLSYSSGSGNSSTSSSGSRGGSGGSTSGGSDRKGWFGSRNGSSTTKPTDKKGYRLSTATEKLPKGLPDWFLRNDADADGQIAMVEYASTWTDQMAADFQKYDLNSDGYITPEECLTVDKKK